MGLATFLQCTATGWACGGIVSGPYLGHCTMQSARSTSPMAVSSAPYYRERADLAAAFRWAARLNFHEGVANHFSVAVNEDGTQFLMNPNQSHFSRIKASDLIHGRCQRSGNDEPALTRPTPPPGVCMAPCTVSANMPAWRSMCTRFTRPSCPRCKIHGYLPIDQNCAMFFNRYAVDTEYGGWRLKKRRSAAASNCLIRIRRC